MTPEQHERLTAMLREANARMDAAAPAGEPYVSPHVTEGVGLYTDGERAAMRAAERYGQASAACMDDIEQSVNDAVKRGVTLKPTTRPRRPSP